MVFRILVLLLAVACTAAHAASGRTLRSVAEIRSLPIPDAAKGLPFDLEVQVLHVGHNKHGVFVTQGGEGIYAAIVPYRLRSAGYQIGSRIRIQGQTHPGSFIPHLLVHSLELLTPAELPTPLPLSYDNLFSPELDCAWVTLEGFVVSISLSRPYLTLQVEAFGSLIDVILPTGPGSEQQARELIHRHVRLRGVAASQANDKRQLTGRNLRVQDFSEIQLAVSRGEIPLVGVDKLLTTQWSSVRKVRVQGVITSAEDQGLYIRGAGGSILARVREGVAAKIGDIVEVLGTVSVQPFSPTLYAEQVTVLSAQDRPAPVPLDLAANPLDSTLNNELVTTSGMLIGIGETEAPTHVILQCREGDTTFDAVLPAGADPSAFRPGDHLALTGICKLIANNIRPDMNVIDGFRISIRSPADVRVLTEASWWTLRRVLVGFAAATTAALLALIWGISLRKRVAYQTGVMRAQVEREAMLGERQRIARELHDTVEQNMTGLAMQLDNASRALGSGDTSASDRALGIARDMLQACRTEARESVLELRAASTPGASVADLVDDSVLETVSASGAYLARETTGEVFDLGHFRTRHVLRATQEAVLNAAKHASPTRIHLHAAYAPEALTITVRDDGRGFDAGAAAPNGHFGIIGMRERCQRIGAKMEIASGADGTNLTFEIPKTDPALP